jgi:hypothetical protein
MRVLRQTQKKTLTEVQPARCRDGSAVARAIRPFLARGLPSLTDHQWEYQIKNSAKRQPAGIPTTARRQHAAPRKLLKVGERGRNRTFNLLIFDQQPQTNAFNVSQAFSWSPIGRFMQGCYLVCYPASQDVTNKIQFVTLDPSAISIGPSA